MSEGMSLDAYSTLAIIGLAAITVITRSFFALSEQAWRLPRWAERGLPYAPIAALCAVVVPELLLTQGQWQGTWQDARIWAAVAGALSYAALRRSPHAVLSTIVVGMLVYLPLHIGWGW